MTSCDDAGHSWENAWRLQVVPLQLTIKFGEGVIIIVIGSINKIFNVFDYWERN